MTVRPGPNYSFVTSNTLVTGLPTNLTSPYDPGSEGGILWSDPELAIQWPAKDVTVSDRDTGLPSFGAYRQNPVSW